MAINNIPTPDTDGPPAPTPEQLQVIRQLTTEILTKHGHETAFGLGLCLVAVIGKKVEGATLQELLVLVTQAYEGVQ